MATSFEIGSPHPYAWPKTNGFHTRHSVEFIVKHLKENNIWNVTEKLDGCNLCFSSQGWISSRNKIISTRESPKTLFQGVHIQNMLNMFNKVDQLKDFLKTNVFKHEDFQVLLFGELILNGTGMGKHDIFKYKERKMMPGDFVCFAIGLVLPENTALPFIFKNGFLHEGNQGPFYIVPMSFYLTRILEQVHITHTPLLATGMLDHILEMESLRDKMFGRHLEGLILSGNNGEGFIKWKYNERPSLELAQHYKELKELCMDSPARKSVKKLQELHDFAYNYANKMEDTSYENMMTVYFHVRGIHLLQTLVKAKREGAFTFHLALEFETEKLLNHMRRSHDQMFDPLLNIQMRDQIKSDLKKYFNNQ